MLMLWIQSRVDYTLNLPQILSKGQLSNNKHSQPSSTFKGFGFFKAWTPLGSTELKLIYSLWPFHTWGINILGCFPLALRHMKYLMVAIEYFTKWIEAEPVAQITVHKIQHFVWKNRLFYTWEFLERLKTVFNGWLAFKTKTTDWFVETTDCLFWYHNKKLFYALTEH